MSYFMQRRYIRLRVQTQLRHLEYHKAVASDDPDYYVNANLDTSGQSEQWPAVILDGISVQGKADGTYFYRVDWESPSDPVMARNWPMWQRFGTMILLDVVVEIGRAHV